MNDSLIYELGNENYDMGNLTNAKAYYHKAAMNGNDKAANSLATVLNDEGNYEEAYYWYEEAALNGNLYAIMNIGIMYHRGEYVKQDYYKAYSYFSYLSERGIEDVSFFMGFYLEYGLGGCARNVKKAIKWYRRGIRANDTSCMVQLGRAYSLGIGVRKDEKKGFKLYKQGADQEDGVGCLNVGYCYMVGQGTRIDNEKALYYYNKGSGLGNTDCDENIKWMYENNLVS